MGMLGSKPEHLDGPVCTGEHGDAEPGRHRQVAHLGRLEGDGVLLDRVSGRQSLLPLSLLCP